MMTTRAAPVLVAAVAAAVAAAMAACTSTAPAPALPGPATDAGFADSGVTPYPQGPYGTNEGDVLQDLAFAGYFAAQPQSVGTDYVQSVTFAQIRNLGYRYALINAAAEWCQPCRDEAALFAANHARWAAAGGTVFSVLTEDTNFAPASKVVLDTWIRVYGSNHTMVHDPRDNIERAFAPPTYPVNFIVDLSTMRIVRKRFGLDDQLIETFETQLGLR